MRIRLALVALAVLLVTAGAAYWWRNGAGARADVIELYGNVDIREVALAFRQGGRLAQVLVQEGAEVSPGERLAELDAAPYRDALAVAEASVQRAQAELDKLRAGSRPQDIQRAEEAVRQSAAAFERLDKDFERQSGLAATGAASQRTLEAARAARTEAAAALAAAEQALSLAREGFRVEDVAAAEAALAGAVAARAQAATALADTQLEAPEGGIVLTRVREPGSMLASRDPVLVLSLRNPTYVRAYVSEPDLGRIAPGREVSVETDSSAVAYRGQIGFISPRAEFTPKSVETTDLRTDLVYRVRIVITGPDEGLLQGMPVTVRVPVTP
jgi:HlyD family secretion protein